MVRRFGGKRKAHVPEMIAGATRQATAPETGPRVQTDVALSRPAEPGVDMTADLMRLIGGAIEEWSKRHNLVNMPKDIVFEQAMLALDEMRRVTQATRSGSS